MSHQRLDYTQQIIAADTKFNKYRGGGGPPGQGWISSTTSTPSQARKIYLKRRIQLLNGDSSEKANPDARKDINYLQIRSQLIRQNVRSQGISDLRSTKSWTVSTGESRDQLAPVVSSQYDFHGFHHLSDLHKAAVTHLMFLHNSSSTLIASSEDGSLSVHSLDSEPPTVTATLTGHKAGVTDFDISTSNELLVSVSSDGSICVWQLPRGVLLRQLTSSGCQPLNSCRFLPSNNNLVVVGSGAGLVQTINISTGIFPMSGTSTVPGSVLSIAMAGQDNLMWAATDRGAIISFRVEDGGKLTKGHRTIVSESGVAVTSVNSRPSPATGLTMLLVNVADNSLLLYKVKDALGALILYKKFSVIHSKLNVRSTFAPLMSFRSGDCVVSASEDGAVYFFDVSRASKSCINRLEAHSEPALAVAFNYNESYLATSDTSGLVIVWKR